MPRIFISYRRVDSEAVVGRIYDRLVMAFGDHYVFKDVERIPPGQDFRDVIRGYVNTCDVMLAVIGPQWLTVTESDGTRRLDNPNDFVRFELSEALQRDDVLVIPTYVMHARPVGVADLPTPLEKLAYNNGTVVRNDPDFNNDINGLIDYLRQYDQERRAGRGVPPVFPESQQLVAAQLRPPAPAYTPAPQAGQVQMAATPLPRQAAGRNMPLPLIMGGGILLLVLLAAIFIAASGGGGDEDGGDSGASGGTQSASATLPLNATAITFSYPDNWTYVVALDALYVGSSESAIAESATSAASGIYAARSSEAVALISDIPRLDFSTGGTLSAQSAANNLQSALLGGGLATSSPTPTTIGGKSGYQLSVENGTSDDAEIFIYEASSDSIIFVVMMGGRSFDDQFETIIGSIRVR